MTPPVLSTLFLFDREVVLPKMPSHIQFGERSRNPELRPNVRGARAVRLERVVSVDVLSYETHSTGIRAIKALDLALAARRNIHESSGNSLTNSDRTLIGDH